MAHFSINGLITMYGEKPLDKRHRHIATDWEAYVDDELVDYSYMDRVNLTTWVTPLIKKSGEVYDGTNGVVHGKVKVYVGDMVSGTLDIYRQIEIIPYVNRVDNIMSVHNLPLAVTIRKEKR